jgi:hypothetical protein
MGENTNDTITLVLDGEVSLDAYARALQSFQGLIAALSSEVAHNSSLTWVVSSLQGSSAISTIRGRGPADDVASVVNAYEAVGEAAQNRTAIPFSPKIEAEARQILKLVDSGAVDSIRFETQQRDAIVRRDHLRLVKDEPAKQALADSTALGAVVGRVDTLSRRDGLRFTLYDALNDKAVSCYLKPGFEEIMRNVWGRLATVTGVVRRDAVTGRPLSIRQVTEVRPLPEGSLGDWRAARGARPGTPGRSPEAAIRAVRDAE